jgi:hypothetical protein
VRREIRVTSHHFESRESCYNFVSACVFLAVLSRTYINILGLPYTEKKQFDKTVALFIIERRVVHTRETWYTLALPTLPEIVRVVQGQRPRRRDTAS